MLAVKRKFSLIGLLALVCCGLAAPLQAAEGANPVLIGLDGEFGHASSTSAEAIRQGIQIAIDEINQAGGVLRGRPLKLVEKANGSLPARSLNNIKEFAAMPDLVAVYCGRFSPTVLEVLPVVHQLQIPLLDPWAAADGIVDNGYSPNYVFRLSLKDSWAANAMLAYFERRNLKRVGLLMLNTSWGAVPRRRPRITSHANTASSSSQRNGSTGMTRRTRCWPRSSSCGPQAPRPCSSRRMPRRGRYSPG